MNGTSRKDLLSDLQNEPWILDETETLFKMKKAAPGNMRMDRSSCEQIFALDSSSESSLEFLGSSINKFDPLNLTNCSMSDGEDSKYFPVNKLHTANTSLQNQGNKSSVASKNPLIDLSGHVQNTTQRDRSAKTPLRGMRGQQSSKLQQDKSAAGGFMWLEAQKGPPHGLTYPSLSHRTYYKGFKKVATHEICKQNLDLYHT